MKEIVNLPPELVACVGEVREEAGPDYLRRKFLRAAEAQGEADQAAPEIDEAARNMPRVAVASADQHPQLHAQQREAIDRFVQCVVGHIEKNYPLLEGETVESDFATYLTEPLFDFPAGTGVIKRMTNMADTYYIVANVRVDERGDLTRPEVIDPVPRTEMLLRGGKYDRQYFVTKGAKSLVTGIASAVGGAIANAIIEAIFPPEVPSYFDEVYKEMARLIGQGLQQDKINSVNGAINAVRHHLTDEYGAARRQSDLNAEEDRKLLFGLLQKYDATFISGPGGMLESLMSEQHQHAGFGVFLLGANLQLALFQEMANVVPQRDRQTNKWLSPLETSYGKPKIGTVAVTAQKFANYADRVWPAMLAARIKNVSAYTYEANKRIVPGDVYWELWGAIDDNGDRKWPRQLNKNNEKDGSNPTRTQLNNDLATYKAQVQSEMVETYSNPAEISRMWRQLVDKPITLA